MEIRAMVSATSWQRSMATEGVAKKRSSKI